ncbi:DUF3015 family protein [Algiphilus sp.]|uniref:DUF3015 family protein n=1 Tax=Algiphilus sp. TaxID=1872431 RepID=UPI0025C4F5E9|nr:DUF3015 family protein [Algiphilus sp.]MCK5771098.1 DUF3015 family protein [Algiphilus sp.]
MMRNLSMPLAAALAATLSACGITSEKATTAPTDLASTTGDAATSASSGGSEDERAALRARHYVRSELDWLEREAATGEGEHIEALAVLLGETEPAAFAQWAQAHHGTLFTDLRTPEELLTRIDATR